MRPLRNTALGWSRHVWLVGLVFAPLLFGSVTAEGQAFTGLWLATGVILNAPYYGPGKKSWLPTPLALIALSLLILPLVPLPAGLVKLISPQTHALANAFPLEQGQTPGFIPLSLAPALTLQRLWELLLIATAFCLARHSAGNQHFPRHLTYAVAAALLALGVSDIAYRAGDRQSILGIWPLTWGSGAGTFANRNHFANWCVVGAVFCVGWVLRSLQPLHSAREGASPSVTTHAKEGQAIAILAMFALVMAVLSGSRGGLLALCAGACVWLALLARRTRRKGRWLWLGGAAVLAVGLLLTFGDTLMARLAQTPEDIASRYPKVAIWKDTIALALKFPLLGTGWGTFVAGFGHYKSFGGNLTFWHAENDVLQLLAECGFIGGGVVLFVLLRWLIPAAKAAWSKESKLSEPEVFFAALAALGAFAAHGLIEFVFQIPSTALLAATLLGYLIGSLDAVGRPAVLPPPSRTRVAMNYAWGAGIVLASVCAGFGWHWWHEARQARAQGNPILTQSKQDQSLRVWPWNSHHQLTHARLQIKTLAAEPPEARRSKAPAIRSDLQSALQADPYNWELRFERAWLDLQFSTNQPLALYEIREVMRLNPLQPQIPIAFASHFASRDPERAFELLQQAHLATPRDLRDALNVALSLPIERARLWSLVPADVQSITTLGDLARDKGLHALAEEAYRRLRGQVNEAELAKKLRQLQHSAPAPSQPPVKASTTDESLLAARVAFAAGKFDLAIHHAEAVWGRADVISLLQTPHPVSQNRSTLARQWRAGQTDVSTARQLAEAMHQSPAQLRDITLLKQLAEKHPDELRLQWILFNAAQEIGDQRSAAQTAIELAARLSSRP